MVRKLLVILLFSTFILAGCTQDYNQYAQAVKEQNLTTQLKIEQRSREKDSRREQHQERIMSLVGQATAAAANTPGTADDLMVPMMIMMMEDKWAVAEVMSASMEKQIPLQKIEAPDSIGDTIQKSTGLILGLASVGLSWQSSNNLVDVATAGINAAGTSVSVSGENNTATVDSNKSGTDNIVTSGGDSTINGSDINNGDTGTEESTCVSDAECVEGSVCIDGTCTAGSDSGTGYCTGARGSVPISFTDDSGTDWVSATCSCGSYQAFDCDV